MSFSGVCKSRRRLKFRLTFILLSLIMSRIVSFLIVITIVNRPFPSFPGPLFQNEGRCSAFDTEMIFHSHANNTHFHKKGCTPSVILIVRVLELGSDLLSSLSSPLPALSSKLTNLSHFQRLKLTFRTCQTTLTQNSSYGSILTLIQILFFFC